MAIELVKELESHVRDEHETDMVDCGEVSKEFDTSDCGIFDKEFLVAAKRVRIISCQLFGIRWILED